jgi:Putative esterase
MTAILLLLAQLVAGAPRTVHDQIGGGSKPFTIRSEILGQTRKVLIHLPPSFAKSGPARRYPTTIVFDGEWMLRYVVTATDLLAEEGQVPESVIVSIENTDDYAGRVHDLTPPGLSVSGSSVNEGGDRFLDFIEKELLPALDAQFRAGPPRTLIGTSSGGILVTYAAATRDTFRFTLALDGPTHLGGGWLTGKLVQRAGANPPPLRYASIESRFGWSDDAWKRLTAAAPSSWLLVRQKLTHESHTSMQFIGTYLGLRELFHDYSYIDKKELPTTSILLAYEKLAAAYGAAVVPPEAVLHQIVEDLLMEGRGAAAHAAFDLLASSYGRPSDAVKLSQTIADAERQPPPSETVEGLLATPFPSPDEIRDYLGEWEGEQWINAEGKDRFVLRLFVKDGKVAGEIVNWPAPNVELVRPLQYLKVTAQGLTFGDMNGMRPRGMLLHEGTRDGDVLSGTVRFGGIKFTPPEGMPQHELRFELRKKR